MIEEETWSRRGWRWGEGGGAFQKLLLPMGGGGVQFSNVINLGGVKF